MRNLDNREARFVDEYLTHLNPRKAALDAGYSATIAKSKAYQWVSNSKVKPHVYAAIHARMEQRSERAGITQEMVLRELARIGFSDIRKVVRWGETMVRMVESEEGEDLVSYHGLALIDSTEVDDDTAAAIAEVSQGRDGLKVKFHDKKGALVEIARHLGMFTARGHADLDLELKRLDIEKRKVELEQLRRGGDKDTADLLRDLIEKMPQ